MSRFSISYGSTKIGQFNIDAPQRRTYAQTLADKPLKPAVAQIPCDVGLFGDEHLQLDLVEMLQDPDPQ